MTVQAVILDWAGTTMDFGCMAPAVVFRNVFENEGVLISMAEARAPMGTAKKVHIQLITEIESVRKRWLEKKGLEPSGADIDRMYDSFEPLLLKCLSEYSELIPGTLELVEWCRNRGVGIGSTTGYTMKMTAINLRDTEVQGYKPDVTVSADEVVEGRPAPHMCLLNAMKLRVSAVWRCVKIDDTCPGIEEGLNAGMWTIGLSVSGNEIGLTQAELARLNNHEFICRRGAAIARMESAGAHYVVDTIADVMPLLEEISNRIDKGEKP